jgi:hypothetical protein
MRRAAAAFTVLLLLVAACSDDDGEGASSATTTAATEPSGEGTEGTQDGPAPDVQLPPGAPAVELLDAGEEPREVLRFEPREGDKQQLTMRQEQHQTVEVGGTEQSVTSITEMDVAYFIDSVEGGVVRTRVVFEDARVVEADEIVRDTLEDVLSSMVGAEGRTEFDTRGFILDAELPDLDLSGIPGAEQMLSALEDQLTSLAAPFPDEPVGTGARWRVVTSTDFAGILTGDTTYTIELTDRSDEEFTAAIDIELVFGSAGGPLEVESSDLRGSGTVTWPVDGVVPLFDQSVEGSVVFTAQGQRVTQRQEQRMVMTPR